MQYFLKSYEARLVFIAMLPRDTSIAHYSKHMYPSSSVTAEATLSNTTEHTQVIGHDPRQQIPKKCHHKQLFILNLQICAVQ